MSTKTNELDAQTKGRITRLSKKLPEELINIILRKDNTERKYAEKIKAQATELSRLYASVENHKKEYKALEEDYDTVKSRLEETENNYDNYAAAANEKFAKLRNKVKVWKTCSVVLGCTLAAVVVGILLI